jgi:diguanylate cyclase (GGDEF)-like protein/PAS domain S-box-containing protein
MGKRHFIYALPVILVLIVAVVGWFVTDYLGNEAREEIRGESAASSLTLSIYVSSALTSCERAVKSLSGAVWIAPALMSKSALDIERANSTLDRYNSAMNASVTYLIDADGVTVASSNRKDPDSFLGKSYAFRPYFLHAIKGEPGRYFGLGMTSGKRGFYASYPVQDRKGNVIGVVAMKKDLDEMETFFNRYPFCFLVSPDGIIFLSSSPAMVLKGLWPLDNSVRKHLIASHQFGDKLSEAVLKKEIADGTEVTFGGKEYLVSRKAIDSEGWSIVLLTPTDRIWISQLIGILATIFVCFLFIFFTGIIYFKDQSQELIRQSEESKHLLLRSVGDGIFGLDAEGRVSFVNPAGLRMIGFSEKEILGQNVHSLVHHSHADGSVYPVEDCPMYASYTRAVESHITDEVLWRKDGGNFPVEYTSTPIIHNKRIMGVVVVIKDITERKQSEEKIRQMAFHDSLTELPNRLMFSQLLNHSIQSARRNKRQLAVFFIDLDRFKIINDTMGHEAGDQLLREIALRFKQSLRSSDSVGRIGGDEFIMLIEEVDEVSQVEIVARKILENTVKPIVIKGEECRVTASIGISIYPGDGEEEESLIKNADTAMYFAKEEGKNNYKFYSKDIKSQSIERLSIERNLRFALENKELSLQYQAKVDSRTNTITGVEALLRWQNPYLGSVSPKQFIPVAEETGLIIPIGKWVMKTACAQNVAWQQQGLPAICVSVNLTLRQLMDVDLIADIVTALNDSGMAPNLLELEITESMLLHDPARLISVLLAIKSMGVRLAIDNFCTAYSSLAQLKHFPIDTLKVDRSLIRNVPKDAEDRALAEAIIAMGMTLSLTVVAEGVETTDQMNFLKEHSCNEMQGYYFSKPIVPKQFADLLREHNPSPPRPES